MTSSGRADTRSTRAIERGDAAAARAPAPGRLVGRRARVERDDDRRAPLLAPLPRPARRRRPTASSRTSCSPAAATTAPGRSGSEGPPDLSTTDRVVRALKLAGVDAGRRDARRTSAREGGDRRSARIFTKCFLALLGQWPWQRIAPIPVELVLLPPQRAVLGLQLRLLGAADVRAALGRPGAAARAPGRRRPARDRRASRRDEAPPRRSARPPPRDRGRRALGARAAGGRRLLGRDPAAVGLVDHHARRARPRLRGRDARAARSRAGSGFMVEDGDRLRPEACQSPVWDTGLAVLALRAAGVAGRPPAARQGRRVAARRGGHGRRATGRSAGPTSRRAAGRSSSRTTSTPTSTTPPSSRSRCASSASGDDAVERGLDWIAGMQSRERRLGRLRRRQRGDLALQAPVLRLRHGHRPAERGRHRARARGARAASPATTTSSRRGLDYLLARAGARTARGWAAGASTTSTAPALRCPRSRPAGSSPTTRRCGGRSPGSTPSSSEDGGFGEDIRSYARAGAARPRRHAPLPKPPGRY